MQRFVKRSLDLVLALFGTIILSPVLLIIMVAISCDSRGPIFYRGIRIGKNWKPFKIFKFRTMVTNAEKYGGASTRDGDPRVTRVGTFLRRKKLDELPQLFNVVLGEMSIVGPRPEVPEYATLYTGEEKLVYTVRPGITDFASLWDSNEGERLAKAETTEETERIYIEEIRPEKVRLQMKYVSEMSIATDIKIILQTIKKLFTNAHTD